MKLKFLSLLFVMLAPLFSHAQGCITVFSEDGDKFYLVLNGVRQNPTPQTNVRVDGLSNEYYNAKIMFDDQAKPEISKNMPTKDAATGTFQEMTYKIKKTKDGDLKLRFFGMTPIPVNYNPPPDMYVAHYGQAAPSNTVTQTTVTTSTSNPSTGNGGATISIGAVPGGGNGGLNMNINVSDPNANSVNQTTTTTTRTYSQTTTTDNGGDNAQAPAGCQAPMDWNSFASARSTIAQASFEDTKLSTAKSIVGSNCVSTDQIIEICKLFGFEASKLNFAKFAYAKTTDRGNYFKVNNVFDFDASKTDLNNFVSRGGR